jgi:hypothetical protein
MENLHIATVGEWFDEAENFDFLSNQNMNEYDFIIIETDVFIAEIRNGTRLKVKKRIDELKEFIKFKNIPVVFLCFHSEGFYLDYDRKTETIAGVLGLEAEEVANTGRKVEINKDSIFSGILTTYAESLEYLITFTKFPGTALGKAKSKNNAVGFYTKEFVFLPALHEDGNLDNKAFLYDILQVCKQVRKGEDIPNLPLWTDDYFLPGELNERQNLQDIEKKMDLLLKAKAQSKERLSDFLPLKHLWTATGTDLENAVKLVFIELGFKILPSEHNRDDLIMEYNGEIIIAEIKGQNKSAAEKNAAQLEKWVSTYLSSHDGGKAKGLLIVNTYREQTLLDRTLVSFPDQMLGYSIARNHCLITTLQLGTLLLFCRKNPTETNETIKILLASTGYYSKFENWTDFIDVQGHIDPPA